MKLELESVVKTYGTQRALDSLDLTIEDTMCLALIGPSGGGKSTTLRLLAGLESPTSGTIRIDGNDIAREYWQLREFRQRVGVVFQAYNLFLLY